MIKVNNEMLRRGKKERKSWRASAKNETNVRQERVQISEDHLPNPIKRASSENRELVNFDSGMYENRAS